MSQFSSEEAARLIALDEGLRAEADHMLADSGLGPIISAAGFVMVGSYAMHTMTWRDLDFERVAESPDWEQHWIVGKELSTSSWVWRFSCLNAYRDPRGVHDSGFYWGLRASNPLGGPIWKLDLWTARKGEFALDKREKWSRLLTEENRLHILAIKEALCNTPEYRRTILSVHIYEAVLENNIRGLEAFREWHKARYGKKDTP
jgi:hypothetical protein